MNALDKTLICPICDTHFFMGTWKNPQLIGVFVNDTQGYFWSVQCPFCGHENTARDTPAKAVESFNRGEVDE